MILRIEDRLASGAYGDIFRAPGGTLVHKLFVSDQHSTNVRQRLTRREDAERRHKVFLSECEAYGRAGRHPYLRDHIARFDGTCLIQDITERTLSVAHQYMLDHCYVMEYIEGVATKIGYLNISEHIQKALDAFSEAGIYYKDASVFFPEDPDRFKFIDFAMQEFEVFA